MRNKRFLLAVLVSIFSIGVIYAQFTGKPRYLIVTKRNGNPLGNITIELFPSIAPLHAKNFDSLVSQVFYDTTAFHRVIPGFMIQGGDPNSRSGPKSTWGYGDPNQPTVNAEFSVLKHLRGILSAARDANINSANSQFFICVAPAAWLDGQYSIYGRVLTGMNIVDTIVNEPRDVNDCPLLKIEMFITYAGSNDTVPLVPVLDTPVNGTTNVTGINKLCKWFAVSDALLYHIDASIDSTFSTLFWSKDVTTPYNTITGLQGSTKYFWRVRANNGGHWSAYSTTWNFSTTMNSGVNNLAFTEKGYRLEQNIPNPASGQTIVKFTMPEKEVVSIILFDALGREVAVLVSGERAKGEHQVMINTSGYPAGTYFYRMDAGNLSDTKKLILKK